MAGKVCHYEICLSCSENCKIENKNTDLKKGLLHHRGPFFMVGAQNKQRLPAESGNAKVKDGKYHEFRSGHG